MLKCNARIQRYRAKLGRSGKKSATYTAARPRELPAQPGLHLHRFLVTCGWDAGRGMAGCRITLSLATRLRICDLAKLGPPHRGPRIPCARQDGHRKIAVPMLRQPGFAAAPPPVPLALPVCY
jgi:hypothetical protein